MEITPIDAPGDVRHRVRSSPIATSWTRRSSAWILSGARSSSLHYFLGMPLPEAAAALGIPLGTAKSRLHRSLAAMRIAMTVDDTTVPTPVAGGQFA